MIEQTIPLDALTAGMARTVREWILPHLSDPMARIQAENLATLLERLPRVVSTSAARAIAADSAEAAALLHLPPPAHSPGEATVDDLVCENSALKERLQALAGELRASPDPEARERLAEFQRFFVRSMARELGASTGSADFAALTSRDREAKSP
ncbi:hypothetical protein EDM76_03950 [bacterium]|nr:MAG: hypothetical protein EDM76_03950 [bacterium]MCL4231186.1 hypothetical protein [Dehalococcoidia bacterium]